MMKSKNDKMFKRLLSARSDEERIDVLKKYYPDVILSDDFYDIESQYVDPANDIIIELLEKGFLKFKDPDEPYEIIYADQNLKENQNENKMKIMTQLVPESLEQLFEAKDAQAAKIQAKAEKTKPVKVDQSKAEKSKQAIKALEKQLIDAKKPGAFKTTREKNAKIEALNKKIKAWKAKK